MTDISNNLPTRLYGDSIRFQQILINLLNNAVKFTPKGQVKLLISVRDSDEDEIILHAEIADTGSGIKPEDLEKIFSSFQQADSKRNRNIEGTGLGLSIVKQLVELMDGEVAVNSVYTKGSNFVVTLTQDIVDESKLGELNLETQHELNERKHYKQRKKHHKQTAGNGQAPSETA